MLLCLFGLGSGGSVELRGLEMILNCEGYEVKSSYPSLLASNTHSSFQADLKGSQFITLRFRNIYECY